MTDEDNATVRLLREIQAELAEMRDDRLVMISILNRHDSSIDGFSAELRAVRSQLDRFRNDMRERLSRIEAALSGARTDH